MNSNKPSQGFVAVVHALFMYQYTHIYLLDWITHTLFTCTCIVIDIKILELGPLITTSSSYFPFVNEHDINFIKKTVLRTPSSRIDLYLRSDAS